MLKSSAPLNSMEGIPFAGPNRWYASAPIISKRTTSHSATKAFSWTRPRLLAPFVNQRCHTKKPALSVIPPTQTEVVHVAAVTLSLLLVKRNIFDKSVSPVPSDATR